jgi:isoquinoline 1-oxidoreductase subunit beta
VSPVTRRDFLVGGAAAGAGLAIGFYWPRFFHDSMDNDAAFAPNAYLKIAADGKITVVVARSEMGQGVRTALPMILAEELEADWSHIAIEQAGASTLFGDQGTGGSASVRTTWDPMRRAGAAAREMLISAAAIQWGVPRSACKAQKSAVVHTPSGRRLTYGELASKAATLPVPTDPPLKSASDYTIVGTPLHRLGTPSKTDGSAQYGIDFHLPGMKYALLARCPVIGGKVAKFDDAEAKKISGVTHVAKIGDSAVAVVAESVWGAMEGRRVLDVTWDEGPNKDLNSAAIHDALMQGAAKKGATLYAAGDTSKISGRSIEAAYEVPFLAHAPMEPGNCTAHCEGSRCEIWAPTQVPQDLRDAAAKAVGLAPEQVTVNITLLGGGFGRRLEVDYGVEAALVSKGISGPVQVLWTREDDMRHSTYRPASYHQLSAVLDAQGWPVAFSHRIAAPSIDFQKSGEAAKDGLDSELKDQASFIYQVPNVNLEYVRVDTAVPLGWLRSVYAAQVAFPSECFLDEIAAVGGKDPLELRLHLLAQDKELRFWDTRWRTDRLRGVLQLAADKAGWSRPLAPELYRGIAAWGCFSSYVAEVVEISMDGAQPRVHRVVSAIDCGQVINPNILAQQIQGGIIFALSAALRGRITVDKGRIVQGNFDDYELVRMNEAPLVESYFVPSTEPPTGAGEPPVPPLAAALCNAIFAATGKRIRSLPLAT